MPKTILCVAAARPNFMKVKPVLDGLDAAGANTQLVHTGQHYDAAMSDVFFEDLGIRKPDHHLQCGSGSHAEQTASVMVAFEKLTETVEADAVVVLGDVNSTVSCALVGAKAGLAVVHVESGLRSRDWAMPEEINRVATDAISDLLLAPSPDAVDNLLSEGFHKDQVHLVGNVMIDTLLSNLERAREREVAKGLGIEGEYGVVTLHRPSNVDDPAKLAALLDVLGDVAKEIPLVFSVHPRTRKALGAEPMPGITVTEPLGYLDFLDLQAGAKVVMTDSGGIQEETTALGIPCLTLRTSTERPITVSEGTNQVVGTDRDLIMAGVDKVLAGKVANRCPELWDGRAGERSATVILDYLAIEPADRLRPTSIR